MLCALKRGREENSGGPLLTNHQPEDAVMATKKGNKSNKGVSLSSHVEKVTSAIHAGVTNALKPSMPSGKGQPVYLANELGPHVNPKTVYVTVTFVIDLS